MNEPVSDQLNRPLNDLRISLTDRCQFRCNYCLPSDYESLMRQQPNDHLSFIQIIQAVRAFSHLGVNKVRLTGGEPLLRKGIADLIKQIKNINQVKDLAITTNGALLEPILSDLIDSGLDRITISLDAVDDTLFKKITGTQQSVHSIIEQIFRCADSELKAIKVNCVIQKGINEHQVIPMLELFKGTRIEVRFIEFMDVGNINDWQVSKVYPTEDLLEQVATVHDFSSVTTDLVKPVANQYKFNDHQGGFGTIASITEPFCDDCNRARLSADGKIYTCLFTQKGHDIRPYLHSSEELVEHIKHLWVQRKDQYSKLRHKQNQRKSNRIEMFVMGG
jgi:cyclic pyranopterin phosphate synthase